MRRIALALLLTTCACSSTSSSPNTDGGVVADDTAAGEASTEDALIEEDTLVGEDAILADAATEAASNDAAPAMEDAGAGACNSLKNDAPMIAGEYLSGPMPTPKGGTIVDGVYVRSRNVVYDATFTPAVTDKTLAWFHGGTADFVQALDAQPIERYTATYVTEGSGLILTRTCSMTARSPYNRYDATPTTIVFYDLVAKRSLHYTRR